MAWHGGYRHNDEAVGHDPNCGACIRERLDARVLRVVDAAIDRAKVRHNDTCNKELGDYPCSCGHDALVAALAELPLPRDIREPLDAATKGKGET